MPLRPKVRHLLDKASVKVVKGDMDTEGDSGGGKNHEAARLARNSTTPGAVTSGNYVYYKVLVNNPRVAKSRNYGSFGDHLFPFFIRNMTEEQQYSAYMNK